MVKKTKQDPAEPAGLFDTTPDTKRAETPAWVTDALVNTYGMPRGVVARFHARQAFGCLAKCKERAERKAAKPTPAQVRSDVIERIRLKLREDWPSENELYDLVCEAMARMGRGDMLEMAAAAGVALLCEPNPPEEKPLPF